MRLHHVGSKSLKKGDIVTPVKNRKITETEAEMAESEAIQIAVTQVNNQAAMAAAMTMTEADIGPTSGTNAVSLGEAWT